MTSRNIACSSDERATRLSGARGEQHGAERQGVPFGMAVEASSLCEMEEALRVRFTFSSGRSHMVVPPRISGRLYFCVVLSVVWICLAPGQRAAMFQRPG